MSVLRVLRLLVVLLFAASVAGLATMNEPGEQAADPGPTATTFPPLTPGRARVTGTLTSALATEAGGDPVTPPFTFAVPDPGRGGFRLPEVIVDRRTQTIEWSGGRPLTVTGASPGVDAKPAQMTIDPGTITWFLDGRPRAFLPGTYRLGSAVAVGSDGLAAPRNAVTFTAPPPDGVAFTTSGGVVAQAPARQLRIESPNGVLELNGELTLETSTVTRPLPSLRFGPGIYVVELLPVPGGYSISAALDGAVTT